jgi:hypothetical protein
MGPRVSPTPTFVRPTPPLIASEDPRYNRPATTFAPDSRSLPHEPRIV